MSNLSKAREWYNKGTEGLYREGEEEIAKWIGLSHSYAEDILKGRFRAGEEIMATNKHNWIDYKGFLRRKGIEIT